MMDPQPSMKLTFEEKVEMEMEMRLINKGRDERKEGEWV
jgi:hypothetical protein